MILCSMSSNQNHLALSDEVRDAIGTGRPVLALESTIITHGMPYPQNVETARLVEAEVRAAGATPASLMAYGVTKMTSRDQAAYGKGSIDGVAAPEAANNHGTARNR